MAAAASQNRKSSLRESERKWGKKAIAAGFSITPNVLLTKQHAIGIDCIDVVLILQIAKFWWRADKKPFPSQVQLARTMNTDLSTIKRHLKRLREDGLISWKGKKDENTGGQGCQHVRPHGPHREAQRLRR